MEYEMDGDASSSKRLPKVDYKLFSDEPCSSFSVPQSVTCVMRKCRCRYCKQHMRSYMPFSCVLKKKQMKVTETVIFKEAEVSKVQRTKLLQIQVQALVYSFHCINMSHMYSYHLYK